jgi:hypothetical protein
VKGMPVGDYMTAAYGKRNVIVTKMVCT